MSFNGQDIPWWLVIGVVVGLLIILIVAYHA
jgi:hypothetical protein